MSSIPHYYLEISSVGVGREEGRFKGSHLTPERQEVPAERLSLYPRLVGAKAQQENQANQRGIGALRQSRGLGINGLFNFRIS